MIARSICKLKFDWGGFMIATIDRFYVDAFREDLGDSTLYYLGAGFVALLIEIKKPQPTMLPEGAGA